MSENGYYMNLLEMTEHTSTHMDAPAHFIEGGLTIDKIPLGALMGRAVVMDMRWAVSSPNDTITKAELEAWEEATGIKVGKGDIVIVYTGWGDKWGKYEEWSEYWSKTHRWPGFSEDAAEFFKERDVAGVCIDTLSIDPAPSTKFEFHHAYLSQGRWALENIALTADSPLLNTTCYVILAPLKVAKGSGGPTRVIAFKGLDLEPTLAIYASIKKQLEASKQLSRELWSKVGGGAREH